VLHGEPNRALFRSHEPLPQIGTKGKANPSEWGSNPPAVALVPTFTCAAGPSPPEAFQKPQRLMARRRLSSGDLAIASQGRPTLVIAPSLCSWQWHRSDHDVRNH